MTTVLSSDAAQRYFESLDHARSLIPNSWNPSSVQVYSHCGGALLSGAVVKVHRRMVLSAAASKGGEHGERTCQRVHPLASMVPLGENLRVVTERVCPVSV